MVFGQGIILGWMPKVSALSWINVPRNIVSAPTQVLAKHISISASTLLVASLTKVAPSFPMLAHQARSTFVLVSLSNPPNKHVPMLRARSAVHRLMRFTPNPLRCGTRSWGRSKSTWDGRIPMSLKCYTLPFIVRR